MLKLSSIGDFFENIESTAKERGTEFLEYADEPSNGLASVMFLAVWNFSKLGPREAAALSYYALFSLFPLLLLLVIGIGQIIGPATTGDQLQDFLGLFLPGATAIELSNTIQRFVEEGSSAGLVAGVSLAWSALSLFSNLESALSRTFRDKSQRPFLKRRAVGLVMIIGLGVLLVANIITSLLFSFLSFIFFNQSSIWLSITGVFVPFGFSVGIFAMMYRWIPRTRVGWDAIWPAALLGGVLWEGAKQIFGLYLDSVANFSLVYGSIATVIVFMLWAFLTCNIILLCAEFCVQLSDWLRGLKETRPESDIDFARDYYERYLTFGPAPRAD